VSPVPSLGTVTLSGTVTTVQNGRNRHGEWGRSGLFVHLDGAPGPKQRRAHPDRRQWPVQFRPAPAVRHRPACYRHHVAHLRPARIEGSGTMAWNSGGRLRLRVTPAARIATPVPTAAGPISPSGEIVLPDAVPNVVLSLGGKITARRDTSTARAAQAANEFAWNTRLPAAVSGSRFNAARRSRPNRTGASGRSADRIPDRPRRPTGQPETQPGDNIILFTIMPEPGSYIMAVRVTWPARTPRTFSAWRLKTKPEFPARNRHSPPIRRLVDCRFRARMCEL